MKSSFFAYPSSFEDITCTIRKAVEEHNSENKSTTLKTWESNDISGVPIAGQVFAEIKDAEYLAADITYLNENVAFEVGFAIGLKKRCLLFRNNSCKGDKDLADLVGIFDTLGYEEYSNYNQLSRHLSSRTQFDPKIQITCTINHKAPVYIVEPPSRTDSFGKLVSCVKKARWKYRSFIPSEDVRLAAQDGATHVGRSAGVICPLLADEVVHQREHNIRSMFVAGISLALEIPTLIIHPTNFTPPMDVRDLTRRFEHPDDIRDIVNEFSLSITEYIQHDEGIVANTGNVLRDLRIGDQTAENEMTTLSQYYLVTDEFQRATRGEVNLVVGRKGSGKTALFVQLRNAKRQKRQNVVVDLKPEGYQLIKLKERVFDHLTEGAQQHLITAFWEYLLLLEITYKVLEKDRRSHLNNHHLTDQYNELRELYGVSDIAEQGDFSERLVSLSNHLSSNYHASVPEKESRQITKDRVTEILYMHDIKRLYDSLTAYLRLKKEVWLLFDNIDKSWNVEGVNETDIFVLRCLIDASRKLERHLRQKGIEFRSVLFFRNDVYDLLMKGSADYGKEMRATLDWNDKNLLSKLLLKRLSHSMNEGPNDGSSSIWGKVAVSHIRGEQSLEYMIDLCLMRPRNLLKIFRYSLSNAINLGHTRVEVNDIDRGVHTYSQDLIMEVDRELTDVFPSASKLIYEFSEENAIFSEEELMVLIQVFGLIEEDCRKVISYLLYYGIVGVRRNHQEKQVYIYDVNYNIEMLHVRIRKWKDATKYVVNPALWPALGIGGDEQDPIP